MKFNLSKKSSGMAMIRRLCPDVKADDLEGASNEELVSLAKRLEKVAIGPGGSLGPSWTQVDNYDPYKGSYYTNAVPNFGGPPVNDHQRGPLPSTNNQTNKSQNSDEQTRGTNDDTAPALKRLKMMDKERGSLPEPDAEYVVSYLLNPWNDVDEIKTILGEGSKCDGIQVTVTVNSYEEAIGKQSGLAGIIVTRRMRRSE
jgi:hypothetical protein